MNNMDLSNYRNIVVLGDEKTERWSSSLYNLVFQKADLVFEIIGENTISVLKNRSGSTGRYHLSTDQIAKALLIQQRG